MSELNRRGIERLPTRLWGSAISSHLRAKRCYPGHVKKYGDGVSRSYHATREIADVWTHDLADVITVPGYWELILSLFNIARAYLEPNQPRLYSVNAFWTRPSDNEPIPDLQDWHRDYDDERFLALFVYGTDVLTPPDGPHCFQARDGTMEMVLGPAGTCFLADTSQQHMGVKPQTHDRLLLWARWGISDKPRTYIQDGNEPVSRGVLGDKYPSDPELQELIKLVVQ